MVISIVIPLALLALSFLPKLIEEVREDTIAGGRSDPSGRSTELWELLGWVPARRATA